MQTVVDLFLVFQEVIYKQKSVPDYGTNSVNNEFYDSFLSDWGLSLLSLNFFLWYYNSDLRSSYFV